jgi:hypothetical protein
MAVDAVGDRIRVAKAVADGSVSARFMLGVAAETIADSAEGYISLLGEIRNLNTSAYTIGTVLFIDPDVPGGLTDEEPVSPALDMSIAIVTRSHASTGIIFVRMWSQGVKLGEVNDVDIDEPADNQILAYDETVGVWKNIDIPESAGIVASATPPEETTSIWFNTETGVTYIYYDDFWTSISGDSGAPIISDTAPSSPVVGMEWFNSSNGKSYIYYSNAWVELDSNGVTAASTGNVIINGAFDIWQRGTSGFSFIGGVYCADRWRLTSTTATPAGTASQQAFASGESTPLGAGAKFFLRLNCTSVNGATRFGVAQRIENVETFAGQTVTLSFWAKSSSNRTHNVFWGQSFGTGGSTATEVGDTFTTTTSWSRITITRMLDSIAGKTIGDSSFLSVTIAPELAVASLDIWGVQLEAGTVATPFRRNAPSIQAELAACQRYYYNSGGVGYGYMGMPIASFLSVAEIVGPFPVTMRATPSVSGNVGQSGIFADSSGNFTAAVSPSGIGRVSRTSGNFTNNGTPVTGNLIASAEL